MLALARADAVAVLELVPSLQALETLRGEWQQLWTRCPDATPFQSPAWILPWARHFASDRIRAIACRDTGVLTALVPFFTWCDTALLAGTGPTDFCDALCAPGRQGELGPMLALLARAAERAGCRWVDLQQLRPHSGLLGAPGPPGWSERVEAGEVCPVTRLSGTDGLGCLSHRWRRNLAQARRRLGRLPGFAAELAADHSLRDTMTALEGLHGRRWAERGERGVFAQPLMSGFLREAAQELSAAGLLRLHRLVIAGRIVAVVLVLSRDDAAYYYLGGFDPAWSRLSPGLVSVTAAMTHAASEGAAVFHFLRGREAYKYHLAAQDSFTFRRTLRMEPAGG